ncbi:MAG TPA: FecR domain-containing protein [Candidatus Wallbacteria bacterium]|nr:FecR domain-containing protein [Candidatus Wallbacteria bacterium]
MSTKIKFYSTISFIASTILLLACFTALVSSAAEAATPAAEPVASVSRMSGDFEYKPSSAETFTSIKKEKASELKLYNLDAIKTAEKISGTIETNYGAKISVEEKTEIEVGIFSVRIKNGDMWINFKYQNKDGKGGQFKVLTPAGTIGIKGTIFKTSVDDRGGNVKVTVTEGAVSFTNNAGESTSISAGCNLTISSADGKFGEILKNDSKDSQKTENEKTNEKPINKENDPEKIEKGQKQNEKPLEINENKDINTEANPFE